MMRLLLYPVRRDQEFHFLHKKGCVWTVHWKMIYINVIKYGEFFYLISFMHFRGKSSKYKWLGPGSGPELIVRKSSVKVTSVSNLMGSFWLMLYMYFTAFRIHLMISDFIFSVLQNSEAVIETMMQAATLTRAVGMKEFTCILGFRPNYSLDFSNK